MTAIKTLRTPESRFEGLVGYDFKPNYIEDLPGYEGIRGHYLDEGKKDSGEVFLLLHGEPTWSYLYRKMIPIFAKTGARIIAPDLLGFGKSDKPVSEDDHNFEFHRNYLIELIKHLDLQNVTLVVQDWGGLFGLTVPMEMKDRFQRLLIMNTAFILEPHSSQVFDEWMSDIHGSDEVNGEGLSGMMKKYAPSLTDEEAKAYSAPFPDETYKAGVRKLPKMVVNPCNASMSISQNAVNFWQTEWDKPTFMAIGMKDKLLGPEIMSWMSTIVKPGNKPLEIAEGGHFVQELGEEIAHEALKHFGY